MIYAVNLRKRNIDSMLRGVRQLPPTKSTNDQMCFCYLLVYGSIEFMIESTIRGWINHYLKKHRYQYNDKAQVDKIIEVLMANAEISLDSNHTINYSKICQLIKKLAGQSKYNQFKQLVQSSSPGGTGEVIASLKRIAQTRHRLAHGIELPSGISPNVYELENDFNIVYTRLVANLDRVLPRR